MFRGFTRENLWRKGNERVLDSGGVRVRYLWALHAVLGLATTVYIYAPCMIVYLVMSLPKLLTDIHQIYQRGSTGEMSKYVPFLHSESSHSLPTQPTDTILALNES